MRPLRAPRRRPAMRDPAPSKWGYRYQRLMLTPGFRGAVRIGVPLLLIAVIAVTWFTNPDNRAMLSDELADAKAAIQARPEFMMTDLAITGADAVLTAEVTAVLPIAYPVSSFDLNFEELRANVVALPKVAEASVKVGDAGALQVTVTPRLPVALWRDGQVLRLIDAGGVFSGEAVARGDRFDLPLIAGEGAAEHIDEALMLFQRAAPIAPRVRGLVRMGARRWDMVLDRGQRIQLPETDAAKALDRVMVLHQAQSLLKRDVAVVDMRNAERPTIRMSSEATAALRRVSELEADE